jgi:outer membrane protein assembly factor BamB
MNMTRRSRTLLVRAALIVVALPISAAPAGPDAKDLLSNAGVKAGLCVHLGCGSKESPGLIADLAAQSDLLVHGLAVDDGSLQRARAAIAASGLAGRALAEKVALSPLPYLPDLANLVVVEDRAALAAQGVVMGEIERITAPGGVICVLENGHWTRTVKTRSPDMDEWPQPAHGPDGNRVSTDRVLRFPVGLRWQEGLPMNFNLWAACRGWVIAGGRCFTLSTTEPENLGPASFAKHRLQEFVSARDAYNGLPLWKVSCETTNDGQALNAFNTAALVADAQRVYVFKKDRLVALDAATGRVMREYPVTHQTARLLLVQGVLVASGWENKKAEGLWAPWGNKTGAGEVEAFDAASGTLKWIIRSPAQEMVAADGLAFLLLQASPPATNQQIVAVNLQTGQEQWRVGETDFTNASPINLNCAGQGVLSVSRPKAKAVSILSAKNGQRLWEIQPTDKFWTPMVSGLLWHGSTQYDPLTGEVKAKLPAGLDSPVCTPAAVVGNYVTASRGCSYIDLYPDSEGGAQKGPKWISYGGARGGCIEGATPANGMFYTGQNFCRCAPGQVPGFIAFGPCGTVPAKADFEKERPREQGEAFEQVVVSPSRDDEWPMFRHDTERSGFARVALPAKMKIAWQRQLAPPATGPLAPAWNARLASCLTAPVAAQGAVLAAATDAGQVIGLDAATGQERWRFSAGSRVDTPPTLHGGRCAFGSHDGWVYALRPTDGALAWRARVAPWERRMMSFGQVESVWPVPGAVLGHGGTLFASAGRTTESDGGLAVCAFDVVTGRQRWATQLGAGPVRENDLLALREGKINLHHLQLEPETGRYDPAAKVQKDECLEGLIDGSWTRLGTRRSGGLKFGRITAEMFVWSDTTVYGYDSRARTVFAIAKTGTEGTNKLTNADFAWRLSLPAQHQVEALALATNGLVLAGRVCDPKTEAVSGFLQIVSLEKGQKQFELPLDAPPVYDGLALSRDRVYLTLQNGRLLCFVKDE